MRRSSRLSTRRIFQTCNRIKKWWRQEELYLYRLPLLGNHGVQHGEIASLLLKRLCPWPQPFWSVSRVEEFLFLPRQDVEIYHLGGRIISPGSMVVGNCGVEFFVLFDWCSNEDVLVKQTWHWWWSRTTLRDLLCRCAQLSVIDAAEWRDATVVAPGWVRDRGYC